LGGWIVLHLLQRGEDPFAIRVLDIRLPTRRDLTSGLAKDVQFLKVDVSDMDAVVAAFKAPWPESVTTSSEITIFHTAANIRFYERHTALLHHSTKVNVGGTLNVIKAAKAIGASALIYTSSGSVAVRRSRFWLWPWETQPKFFVQVLNDDDNLIPKRHEDFFSNYAVSKIAAERLVRDSDGTPSGSGVLKTGCIRPGNGVFGPGGDILCGAYLVRKEKYVVSLLASTLISNCSINCSPTWISNILHSFSYVENCSLAHLCYERCLIDLAEGADNPDIGGQAFNITDPGPPPTYGDVYVGLETLSNGEAHFPSLSPSAMLLLSHVLELYYLSRYFLTVSTFSVLRYIGGMLPPVGGDIVNLQPSLFSLTSVHLIFDDSRARLSPKQGGLGYKGLWTTLDGICKTVDEHMKAQRKGEERSTNGGVSFGFGLVKAQRGVERVGKNLPVDPVRVLN
jgi:nucleoside-diphosphate-sugar epimerase